MRPLIKTLKAILLSVLILFSITYIALIVYAYLPYEEIPINKLASDNDRFISIEERNIRYRISGEDKNPNIILIHGFGNSINTWRKVIPELEQHYRVIVS